MSSSLKNLSSSASLPLPDGSKFRIGIVRSDWNEEITLSMEKACLALLKKAGVPDSQIFCISVPGSFELCSGIQHLHLQQPCDALIGIGCIIKGETPHFDFIAQAVAGGFIQLSTQYEVPVVFGVLTTLTHEQALERSGGKHGNKGEEAAYTALQMASLFSQRKGSGGNA